MGMHLAAALRRGPWASSPAKRRSARGVARRRRSRLLLNLSLGFCLVVVALFHVWLRLQGIHLGYVLSTTARLQGQLEQENRELQVELATLTSPERLGAMAQARLGLVEPGKGQVVILP